MQSDFEKSGKLQRKIDIFYAQGRVNGCLQWHYACSTNHWRTCRDAKASWLATRPEINPRHVRARFAPA